MLFKSMFHIMRGIDGLPKLNTACGDDNGCCVNVTIYRQPVGAICNKDRL
jgi:hypothetical protein